MWYWWWNINNSISFYFRLFPIKTKDNIFQEVKKKSILWPFWAIFAQIWAITNFHGKKGLVSKYSNYLLSCQISEKTNDPFLRNMLNWKTDTWKICRTDRQTNNQAEKGDFLGPSIERGSKKDTYFVIIQLIVRIITQ